MATRWRPDTCSCIIEYEGDFASATIVEACRKHDGMTAADVLAHNRRKNDVLVWLGEQGHQLVTDTADGAAVEFDRNASSANDPVMVRLPKLNGQQRSTLQRALDTRYGAGNVVVVAS